MEKKLNLSLIYKTELRNGHLDISRENEEYPCSILCIYKILSTT